MFILVSCISIKNIEIEIEFKIKIGFMGGC